PPGAARQAPWLAGITIKWLETDACGHARETRAYQPSPALRHLIKTRDQTCSFPGCRRPARRCDDDHTQPFDQGGRTCECNLTPLCRRHHAAKQAPGWHLDQPAPGVLIWTLPSGRVHAVRRRPYPA
ncbi:MAG: HNH endonuclease signature motif containing protein, partial [Streptosporangiaceae bacterium]